MADETDNQTGVPLWEQQEFHDSLAHRTNQLMIRILERYGGELDFSLLAKEIGGKTHLAYAGFIIGRALERGDVFVDMVRNAVILNRNNNRQNGEDEAVNHPRHYNALGATCAKCGHPIECIDVVRHMGFSDGNAVKYLWRRNHKGALEDLRKARWYLDDLIHTLEHSASAGSGGIGDVVHSDGRGRDPL